MKTIAIGRSIREYVALSNEKMELSLLIVVLAALLVGLAIGATGFPVFLAMMAVLIGLLALGLLAMFQKGYRVFWIYLILLLLGYQFLGRGFAYVGVAPVYVAEIGLALAGISGLLMLLSNRLRVTYHFVRLQVVLLVLFMAWQAIRAIPYLRVYAVDTLRDSALWGYAFFALFILLFIPKEGVDWFFRFYGRVLPFYLLWLPIAFVFVKLSPLDNISFPGAPVPLLSMKSGGVGVHLAGAGAFMLLRLDRRSKPWSNTLMWLLWLAWGAAWVAFSVTKRAAIVSVLIALGVVVFFRPGTRWYRPLILAILVLGLLWVTNLNVDLGGPQNLSFQQVVDNFESLVGQSEGVLENTKQFRYTWWTTILDYTLWGPYFWTGKGYGLDLSEEIGGRIAQQDNRRPHNVSMTVLARSGVPGLVLWVLFLLSYAWMLVKILLRRRQPTDPWTARYSLWVLAYWLAALLNASFSGYLEGPMGAVWFWSLTGMGLVYFGQGNRMPQTATTRQNREPSQLHLSSTVRQERSEASGC